MAERRMFTRKVTDDDHFVNLSSSAQALYLHLSMTADDDGFNNQVSTAMFRSHASIQDLQSLLENRYIYQFDNGVIVIKHWRMANALRKDRYNPTTFQEELAQLQLKDNGSYTWLPDGCRVVAERLPQTRTDEDSIGKYSVDKDSMSDSDESERTTASPFDDVMLAWNAMADCCADIKSIKSIGGKRKDYLKARIKDYGTDGVIEAIRKVKDSDFLQGKGKRGWVITFDWFVMPMNFQKVAEGNYDNRQSSGGSSPMDDLQALHQMFEEEEE